MEFEIKKGNPGNLDEATMFYSEQLGVGCHVMIASSSIDRLAKGLGPEFAEEKKSYESNVATTRNMNPQKKFVPYILLFSEDLWEKEDVLAFPGPVVFTGAHMGEKSCSGSLTDGFYGYLRYNSRKIN